MLAAQKGDYLWISYMLSMCSTNVVKHGMRRDEKDEVDSGHA